MNDIGQDASARYAAIDIQHQLIFLSRLAHRFILVGREAYDDHGDVTDGGKLKSINEVQHRISSQQLKMLMGDGRRYPDDVFVNILVDYLQALKINPENVFQWN
ncbi:MAG TPA: hypothetical protein VKC66_28940 [Xanthobacteraceae bacterium]|nr:hypothetical protein [Xanthobacteraceae bacterium]